MRFIESSYYRGRRLFSKICHWTELGFFVPIHFVKLLSICLSAKLAKKKVIAIALIEHLGDIVACEPVVGHLKSKYKDSFVIWFVRKPYAELVESHPQIDKSFRILCLTEWILLRRCNLFDEIVDLHFQGRICPYCLIPLKKEFGNLSITLNNYFEYGNLLKSFCSSAGMVLGVEQPHVYISKNTIKTIDRLDLPPTIVTIHCKSNGTEKDWPSHKWERMVHDILRDNDIFVVEIGTVSSLHLKLDKFLNLSGRLNILESAEVIRRSKLFIGVDSGPAQLANAVQTPGVLLFGDYKRFKNYMPYSGFYMNPDNVDLIYAHGPVAELGTEKVIEVVRKRLQRIRSIRGVTDLQ